MHNIFNRRYLFIFFFYIEKFDQFDIYYKHYKYLRTYCVKIIIHEYYII
jgi:hypothetical protein